MNYMAIIEQVGYSNNSKKLLPTHTFIVFQWYEVKFKRYGFINATCDNKYLCVYILFVFIQ